MTETAFETTTQELAAPLDDIVITDVFGSRTNPVTGRAEMHKGTDLAAAVGTPVAACAAGTVEESGYSPSYGNFIKIRGENYTYLYAHLSELKAQKGDSVQQGDTVALSGSTGQATGPHLHFELYKGDELIDPNFIFEEQDQ